MRWPGQIPAGSVCNGVVLAPGLLPTLLAAAGEPDIVKKLLDGHTAGDKTFKVHIDGYNMLPYLTGEVEESPREFFFYVNDDGDIVAMRIGDWKVVFMEQRATRLMAWLEPFVKLRVPKIFHLRRDPFERADDNSNTYWDWMIDHALGRLQDAGHRRRPDPELRRLPAPPEARLVQPRCGNGAAGVRNGRREPLSNPPELGDSTALELAYAGPSGGLPPARTTEVEDVARSDRSRDDRVP